MKTSVLFGQAGQDLNWFKSQHSNLNPWGVKQTHSDTIVIHSSDQSTDSIEADGIIAHEQKNLCIFIKTADCLPIFILAEKQNIIAAVHAGWRGIANQITIHAINKIISLGASAGDLKLIIGPHIQKQSFEVQSDVKDILLASVQEKERFFTAHENEKFNIDLSGILIDNCKQVGIQPEQWTISEIDTVGNSNFHSFRRDKAQAGRNLSFLYCD